MAADKDITGMTDEQLIEAVATDVMGWEKRGSYIYYFEKNTVTGEPYECGWPCSKLSENWNPLTNWNHWRQVEETIIEDEDTWIRFRAKLPYGKLGYVKSGLRDRCLAALSAIRTL